MLQFKINGFIALFLIFGCLQATSAQFWNNNVNKNSNKNVNKNIHPAVNVNRNEKLKDEKYSNQQPIQPVNIQGKYQENPWYKESAQQPSYHKPQNIVNKPIEVIKPVKNLPVLPMNHHVPHVPVNHVPHPPIVPVEHVPLHHGNGPFPIQKPVLSYTGEVIIENTVGGIQFDCRGLPTGHWRDPSFCDVFHACVHGYHRKTYTCPIVGLRTYFDEVTQKCEFVHINPTGCSINKYVKK
jgi:hypothetical protein